MAAEKPSTYVPTLRFPEFMTKAGWQLKEIGPFLQKSSDRVEALTDLPIYTSSRLGLKPQEDYYRGNRVRNSGEYGVVPPDCIVYRHMSDDGIFAFHANTTGGPIAVSKEYPVFRCVGIDTRFLLAMLNYSPAFKTFAFGQKIGSTRTRLYLNRLRTWITPLPSPPEQQKIADFLGSLDDLIAAEEQKLEALRQHKQGLMQQLFPQPGETVPRLRFPEFVDAPQWQISTFGERCESFSGSTPDTSNKNYYGGTIPFIRSAEIGCCETEIFLTRAGLVNSAAKMVKRGDLLVALYGANSGDTALARVDGAINQAIMCLRSTDSAPYLYHYLTARKSWIITTYLQGGQGNLSGQILLSVPLSIPNIDEQQKIANCLNSLDDLIAAVDRSLEALQRHKRGLMQQLFPKIDCE